MKKRILLYILAFSIIGAQSGCLQFFAEKKKECEVNVDYIYYLNQGSVTSGDFSLLNYKTSGFTFSNVPVDKEIVSSDCPNYDVGIYKDVAEEISYDSLKNMLYIRLVTKNIGNAPTWANFEEVYIEGNFEIGDAVIGKGGYDEKKIYCIFDFDNMHIHLVATTELEYVMDFND